MSTRRGRARISFAVLIVLAIVAVFVSRLVDIQIVRADELNAASEEKRAQQLITYGVRGNIVDANGAVLADSVERYDITASPRNALRRENAMVVVLEELARLTAVTGQDPNELLNALMADPDSDFAYLTKGVTLEVFEAVAALDIPWIYFELRPARTYPNGQIAGNLVGFIGTDGPQEGLERSMDECLASDDGVAVFERGVDGVRTPGSEVTEKSAKDGGTLRLTIDRDLQWYVQQRTAQTALELGATWATSVVMRVSDGALMAVADWPTVDPNNVDDAPRDALGSRAFAVPYEPGSTIKVLTAASVIDAGVANPGTQVVAPYRIEVGDGSTIKDWTWHDTWHLTLTGALVESSNTAVAAFTDLVPAEARYDYLRGFGFDEYTEVQIGGESAGLVHPPDEWDAHTNYAVQFGQGLQTTSVQMASAYQTIANGGVRMPVTLVLGCEWPDGTVTDTPTGEARRVVSEQAADQTLLMMEKVATESGSARNLTIPGYRVAVKSGTAEVAENGVYTDKVVISYAGMAPAEDPEYVVIATAGIPGSMMSGRIAKTFTDIMAQALTTFRVTPSTQPAPELPLTW
jgi:cell division protein FtsI (penicillin-binding protein 3)